MSNVAVANIITGAGGATVHRRDGVFKGGEAVPADFQIQGNGPQVFESSSKPYNVRRLTMISGHKERP